jgi:hypothetical protein
MPRVFVDFGTPIEWQKAKRLLGELGAVRKVEMLGHPGSCGFAEFVNATLADQLVRRRSNRLPHFGWIQVWQRSPRLCRFYENGTCGKGDQCDYTHAERQRSRSRSPRRPSPRFQLRLLQRNEEVSHESEEHQQLLTPQEIQGVDPQPEPEPNPALLVNPVPIITIPSAQEASVEVNNVPLAHPITGQDAMQTMLRWSLQISCEIQQLRTWLNHVLQRVEALEQQQQRK